MGEIAPEEQFLPLSTIFYYLMLDFYVKTGIRFSLRVKRLFEITEVEITRVDYLYPKIIKIIIIKKFTNVGTCRSCLIISTVISILTIFTVELQWLKHLWNHENMFETGVA